MRRLRPFVSAFLGTLLVAAVGVAPAAAAARPTPAAEPAHAAVAVAAPPSPPPAAVSAPEPPAVAAAARLATADRNAERAATPDAAPVHAKPARTVVNGPGPGTTKHTISGHVYKPDGAPLSGVLVETWPSAYGWSELTGADGAYSFELVDGTYNIYFNVELQPYLYGCYLSTDPNGFTPYCDQSTVVNLTSDMTIDARMQAGHLIKGRVTGLGGTGLAGIGMHAASAHYEWNIGTADDGTYEVRVADGAYTLRFYDTTYAYATGFYSTSGFTLSEASASPVTVAGADRTGINVQMLHNYRIQGTLTGSDGTALASRLVHATTAGFDLWTSTAADGTYQVDVPSGTYTLEFPYNHPLGYWDGFYAGGGNYGFAGYGMYSYQATPITLGTTTVSGIDVHAPPLRYLQGTITNASHAGVADVTAYASSPGLSWGAGQNSVAGGAYSIAVLPGTYTVSFGDSSQTYLPGYYSTTGFKLDYEDASPVTVSPTADRTGVDVELPAAVDVSGTVTGPDGKPLENISVQAVSDGFHQGAYTNASGAYSLPLAPGNYSLTFIDATNVHQLGFWGGSGYTPDAGSIVPVVVGSSDITGRDVTMPLAATSLRVTGLSSPRTAGSKGSLSVQAIDSKGGVASAYRGLVHFTSTDTQASLPADYQFAASDAGVHVFSVTLKTAGAQAVRARDVNTTPLTGVQQNITVTAAPLSVLSVTGLATPRTAGAVGSLTVKATDAYGNVISSYAGRVHFTSTDPQAVLPADYTFIPSDAGSHTFASAVTLKTAGLQAVRARDTVTTTLTGLQQKITVNPAAVAKLVVAGIANPYLAGGPDSFTVTAADQYGNRTTGYRGTVHFTSTDTAATLPADYVFTAADAGVHTFKLTLRTVGSQAVRARDTVTTTITGLQSGIVVHS